MQVQPTATFKKKIILVNNNDAPSCVYQNLTQSDANFIELLHELTTIDFNGKYLVNITFTELERFKIQRLDIFKKYKQYLRQVEAYQDRKAQMQKQMNEVNKKSK